MHRHPSRGIRRHRNPGVAAVRATRVARRPSGRAFVVPDQQRHPFRARQDPVQDPHRLPVLDRLRASPGNPPHASSASHPQPSTSAPARSASQATPSTGTGQRSPATTASSYVTSSTHSSPPVASSVTPTAFESPARTQPNDRPLTPRRIPPHPHQSIPRPTRRRTLHLMGNPAAEPPQATPRLVRRRETSQSTEPIATEF